LLVNALRERGVENVNLWGRSMGASTILYFLKVYGEREIAKSMVRVTVLDSPFCSFEQIAMEMVGRNSLLPGFVCSPLVHVTMRKVLEKYNINLRLLNFVKLNDVSYPAVFIYSEKDQIVDCSHSISIIKDYGGFCKVLKNSFEHNEPRG
jgi:pimeloyl-ACP methyl ester carboxylesterase